jgi:hypothetical protein
MSTNLPGRSITNSATAAGKPCIPAFPLPFIPTQRQQRLDVGARMAVYIAGSRAHEAFLKPLGVTAFQIGVTGRRDVAARISDKRKRRYGALLVDPHNPENEAQCLMLGGDVFLSAIDDDMLDGITVPTGLATMDGVITFRVQPGTSVEQVEPLLNNALAPRSLNRFLATVEGQNRMRQAGFNPRHWLMTAYTDVGRNPRYSIAEEVFLIRPRREIQGLLDLIAVTVGKLLVS